VAPGLAPQLAAFKRRLFNVPAPARSSGEASNGQPVQVEIYINGAWIDITPYVMVRDDQGRISITYGIRDEGSQTEQSTNTLPLKNVDGRFTRRNPTGPYYGSLGRNTPCRISVPDGNGGKSYRQQSEISKWPKSWDPTGSDVWVDVSATGLLQRLSQGPPPDRSVIYNAITNPLATSVVAYWPMEDATGSIQLASALTSGSPMTWSGTPALASYEGVSSSDPLPDLTSGALSGGVTRYDDPVATQVRFLAYIPKAGLSDGKVLCAIDQLDYSAGSAQIFELYYSTTDASNSLVLHTLASDGTVLGAVLPHTLDVRGRLLYVSVELQESGTGITRQIQLKDVTTSTVYTVSDTENLTQLTRATKIGFGVASRAVSGPAGTANLPGVAVGHCTVETQITPIDALGVRLNPIGETAGRRIQRLCGEQGIPFEWVGDLDDTVPLGAQTRQNLLNLVQECVLADDGILYENRTRASLYNQDPTVVLDYTAYNLSDIPTPVEDDRYLANKVVISVAGVTAAYEQTDGPLSTAPPPAGVGEYGPNKDSALELNLSANDSSTLLNQAAWRVHTGTVDEDRFPQISVNLAHQSFVANPAMRRAVLSLRMGDRVQIVHPPLWVGPDTIDQLVLGIEESITHFEHRITLTCAPASPYSGIGYLDTNSPRMDTAGSQLAADATSTATSLTVATTSGPVWVQYGQLNANRNFETDLSNWSGSGATIARVPTPAGAPFTGLWSMQITPDGAATFPNAGSEQIPVTVGQQYTLQGWLYCATSRAVDLNINWFDGTHAYLSTSGSEQTVTANTWTWFQQTATAPASAVYANLAPTVPTTPPSTDVLTVDEILFYPAGETPLPDEFPFDIKVGGETMTVTKITGSSSPQTFTVTRSANGVVKAQTTGTAVELAHPYYIAL